MSLDKSEKAARTLLKLEASLAAGDYYGALQLYRTIVKRQLDAGDFDAGAALVASGVAALARHGRAPEGADLYDMLIKTLTLVSAACAEPAKVAALVRAADAFTASDAATGAASMGVLASAARWVAGAPLREGGAAGGADEGTSDAAKRRALAAPLHMAAAAAAAAAGADFAPDAARHYLEAAAPADFGAFLVKWAKGGLAPSKKGAGVGVGVEVGAGKTGGGGTATAVGGYAGEGDLFLARAVMQLLCLGNLGDANAVRDAFIAVAEAGKGAEGGEAWFNAATESPLAHWTKFALLTCEVSGRSRSRNVA